jgi:hypothetical protein
MGSGMMPVVIVPLAQRSGACVLPSHFDPRGLLLGTAVLAFTAGGCFRPAIAEFYDSRFDPLTSPSPIGRTDLVPGIRPKPATDIRKDAEAAKKPESKDFGPMPKGPLQIVVSIADQHVTLYSNGVRVAQGPISTGVPGRPTPTGVFSIIQKDRFHHSNLYSNAPMPYMERITWSGVALHEGPLPGYPASHGCIRLSHDFALRLWSVARLGVRVVVAHDDVVPAEFSHPHLFEPKPKTEAKSESKSAGPVTAGDPAKDAAKDVFKPAEAGARRSFAQATIVAPDSARAKPGEGAAVSESTSATDRLRGSVTAAGSASADHLGAAAATDPAKPAEDPQGGAPSPAAPPSAPAVAAPVKHTGAVAVFISRREKKLYVRQGFEPLFDTPVEIEHAEQPFGTHVFTALALTDDGARMRWNLMSIAEPPRPPLQPKIGPNGKVLATPRPVENYPPQTAAQVLDRIQIPQEALDRIGEILAPGSSLVVSDQGLGEETGEGTDFIVLTR